MTASASTAIRAREIFLDAVEHHPLGQLGAFLDSACEGDDSLRMEVQRLLEAHGQLNSFMAQPAAGMPTTVLDPASELVGAVIGPYKLLEQIGEGGFGIVYMADQQSPVRRRVALKIIKPGMDTRQVLARFKAELQALSLMDHPNIARALDAGATDSGRPYFVMELVRGVSITDYCDQNHLAVHDRLHLFIQVCHAVQHAHQKGVIHRDIKPSNVLVTMQDSRPIPKVIDFGVAKAINQQLTQETIFTRFAEMIGTPLYMSPEQAEMTSLDIDTRSDIYSLGVVLYELLTGSTPFEKHRLKQAAFDEIRRIIREEEPLKPSTRISTLGDNSAVVAAHRHADPHRLGQLMRGDLDWIVMKALEKDRTRRYETANGLAMDIERHLADEPVSAGPPSALYRFRKFARRNKAVLAAGAAITAVLLLGLAGTTWQAIRATDAEHVARTRLQSESQARASEAEQRREADLQREQAVAGKAAATQQLYVAQINLARKAWDENNVGRTRELLQKLLPEFTGGVDLRGWEWNYLWRLSHSEFRTLNFWATRLAFTPDGRSLISGGSEGVLKMWETDGFRETWSVKAHDDRIDRLAVSGDGKLLATASPDGAVKLWDIATRRHLRHWEGSRGRSTGLAFSPDGARLAMNSPNLSLWSTADGTELFKFAGDLNCSAAAFSPDGQRLAATIMGGRSAHVWDASNGRKLGEFLSDSVRKIAIAFSTDSRLLAVGDRSGAVKIRNFSTGQDVAALKGHADGITRVLFGPDRKVIITASDDTLIKIWNAATSREIGTLRGHDSSVCDVSIAPNQELIASAGWDATIRVWDAASRQEPRMFQINNTDISSLAFSPDGISLAIGCHAGSTIIDASTGLLLRRMGDIQSTLFIDTRAVRFHPDGRTLASGLSNGYVDFHSVTDGRTVRRLKVSDGAIAAVAFSENGQLLATGSDRHEVAVWNVINGRRVAFFNGHADSVTAIAFSPDGKYLASAASENDKTVILWDITTGSKVRTFTGHSGGIQTVIFSHDGKQIVSGGTDNMIRIWEVESGAAVHVLRAHAGTVRCLALSPDGRRLASCGNEQKVKIWDVFSWQELQTLSTKGGQLNSVAFSPDGTRLATGGSLRHVILWDARPLTDELRVQLCAANRVESLFAEHLLYKNVIRALNDDPMISDGLRRESLKLTQPRQVNAGVLNQRSWFIANQAGLSVNQYRFAVELAQAAAELAPKDGYLFNTLGVAHYRAGDWKAAITALEKSMTLLAGKFESFNTFFLAMAKWRLGLKDEARKCYDQAISWMEKNAAQDKELNQFRAEAAELLGLKPSTARVAPVEAKRP